MLATAIDGAMAHMDRQMTHNLAKIIIEVPAKAVLLAIPRRSGQLQAGDRRLWSDLQRLVGSSTELVNLVVINDRGYRAAREPTFD